MTKAKALHLLKIDTFHINNALCHSNTNGEYAKETQEINDALGSGYENVPRNAWIAHRDWQNDPEQKDWK